MRSSNSSIRYAEEYYKNEKYPVGYNLKNRTAAYYTALANEKQKLTKLSDYISGSGILEK